MQPKLPQRYVRFLSCSTDLFSVECVRAVTVKCAAILGPYRLRDKVKVKVKNTFLERHEN